MQQPPRFYADADTFLLIVAHLSTTDVLACGVACTTLRALCDDVLSKSSVARLGPLATPEEMLWLLRTRVGAECTRLDVSDCTALSKSVVSRGVSACPHLVTLQAVRVGVGSWTALSLQRLLQSAPPSLRHAHVDLRVALDELQGPATLAHRLLSSPSLKVGKLVLVASEAAVGHAAPDLEAVRALGATLGAKHTELAELDASSGSLRGIGLVDALLSPLLLAPSCGLRTLACSAIPRLCARALVTALGGNRSLRSLALGCNSLDAAAAVALGAALRGHPSLTSLQVEHNQILDRGAAALADALPATRIASLRLSFTGAADGCMRAVAASLTEGCSLAELRLSGNLVGQEGAVALAAALGSAGSSLRALSLSANWKVDTAAQLAVVGALAGSELHELSLAGCNVSTSTCEKARPHAARPHARRVARARVARDEVVACAQLQRAAGWHVLWLRTPPAAHRAAA